MCVDCFLSERLPLFVSRDCFKPTPLWGFLEDCFEARGVDKATLPESVREVDLYDLENLRSIIDNNSVFLKIIKTVSHSKKWDDLVEKLNLDGQKKADASKVDGDLNDFTENERKLQKLKNLLQRFDNDKDTQQESKKQEIAKIRVMKKGKLIKIVIIEDIKSHLDLISHKFEFFDKFEENLIKDKLQLKSLTQKPED